MKEKLVGVAIIAMAILGFVALYVAIDSNRMMRDHADQELRRRIETLEQQSSDVWAEQMRENATIWNAIGRLEDSPVTTSALVRRKPRVFVRMFDR